MTIEHDRQQKISILASYDAMVEFIESWFEQSGRSSDDIAQMLGALSRHDELGGYSLDGAVWNEYMNIAYRKLAEEGGVDPLRSTNSSAIRVDCWRGMVRIETTASGQNDGKWAEAAVTLSDNGVPGLP